MSQGSSNYQLLIAKLDAFIRKYYLNQIIRGSLYTIGLLGGLFLIFSITEYNLYLSTSLRKILFYGFLGTALVSTAYWVIVPILHYFRLGTLISQEKAASIIGDHFADVKDKLLNILQLRQSAETASSPELIFAGIDQKSEDIKLVPFKKAINLSLNKRHLRYAVPPLLIIAGILLTAPSILTESTSRIIKNDTEFVPDAPFSFLIKNESLNVPQYENFTLEVATEGSVAPEDAFVSIDGSEYRLTKTRNNTFTYTFNTVQSDLDFTLVSGPVKSQTFSLSVLVRPQIGLFDTELDYPSYTGYRDETLKNKGDLVIPEGTKVTWAFQTLHADEVAISILDEKSATTRRGENEFIHSTRIRRTSPYKVFLKNSDNGFSDSVSYNISVIPDQYPSINLEIFNDTVEQRFIYFLGDISDDYGLKDLTFNYRIQKHKADKTPLESQPVGFQPGTSSAYDFQWDLLPLALQPGDELEYYFEVFDNDAVNGSKSARSAVMTYKLDTEEEIEEKIEANSRAIKDKLESTIDRSREIQKELQKLREKMLDNQEPRWEDKKKLEDLLKQQQELQRDFQKAKEQFQENSKHEEKLSQKEEELLEKQEKLEEMFEEVVDKELQELMDEIQKLMEELEKDTALEKMEEMKMSSEEMEKEMDRLLELYKQLELEKDVNELTEDLEKLAEKQEELSEKTEEQSEKQEDLQKEQEEINDEFDKLQEKAKELEKKNSELEKPKDLDNPQEKMDDIDQDLENSKEQLEQQQNSKASKSQKSAAGKMKKMASSLQQQMMQQQQEQEEEDIKTIRQLLENLVSLSFDQEDLVTDVSRTNPSTPTYVKHVQTQYKLKDDFSLIRDTLEAVASRNFNLETYIMDKVGEINGYFETTLTDLEERAKGKAGEGQRRIMKNVNDLALMLAESMQKMQEQLANKKPGNQMCNKPGGQGKSGAIPMDKISEGQKSLGEELQKLKDGLKKGEGQGMSKEFAKAAARQAAMRRALEEMQKKQQEEGKGAPGLQELIDQMDKMEIDLVNKRLDNQAFMRQNDILTRLLQAEKAERKREEDQKRQSTTAQEVERKLPPNLEEYLKQREAELEQYQRVSPELRPYYKLLVDKYYKNLKTSSE